jgi:hypothetical protein
LRLAFNSLLKFRQPPKGLGMKRTIEVRELQRRLGVVTARMKTAARRAGCTWKEGKCWTDGDAQELHGICLDAMLLLQEVLARFPLDKDERRGALRAWDELTTGLEEYHIDHRRDCDAAEGEPDPNYRPHFHEAIRRSLALSERHLPPVRAQVLLHCAARKRKRPATDGDIPPYMLRGWDWGPSLRKELRTIANTLVSRDGSAPAEAFVKPLGAPISNTVSKVKNRGGKKARLWLALWLNHAGRDDWRLNDKPNIRKAAALLSPRK